LAVPVQSLADFVSRVQPCLIDRIFTSTKEVSPDLTDLYSRSWPRAEQALQHRSEEPPEVKLLRSKAQQLADSMRDFIAVQTFAWGSANNEPREEAAYEVRVLDGYQSFRAYPNGKKVLRDSPLPSIDPAISTGGDWADLPEMVGTELKLKIYQAPDAVIAGRRVKVFEYRADVEDSVCDFMTIVDFVFFKTKSVSTLACYGEVWTDEDTNILRMSLHLEQYGKWKHYQSIVTYGWCQMADNARYLVPLTISSQAEFHKRTHWCRGRFLNYQVFRSQVKMATK